MGSSTRKKNVKNGENVKNGKRYEKRRDGWKAME
jgi:hypothetical protein